VILTYAGGDRERSVAGVRSNRRGTFRHVFGFRLGRCASFSVRAVGLRGSRAVLHVDPMCKQHKSPPKRALVTRDPATG
jgi:hypothetical protein